MFGLGIIFLFLSVSSVNQAKYTFYPFIKSCPGIFGLLWKDDVSRLKELIYPVYQIVTTIRSYPQGTNFYFAPDFEEANYITGWYVYILTRYFAYPQKVFKLHHSLYNHSINEYIQKYIGGQKKYSELDWIISRNIKYIITIKNNWFSILPVDSDITI